MFYKQFTHLVVYPTLIDYIRGLIYKLPSLLAEDPPWFTSLTLPPPRRYCLWIRTFLHWSTGPHPYPVLGCFSGIYFYGVFTVPKT